MEFFCSVSLCGGMVGVPHLWDAQRLSNERKWLSTPGVESGNGFSCWNTSGGNLTGLQML